MKKILVAGAGLIGKAIAVDLTSNFSVSVVDKNVENLLKLPGDKISTIAANFNDKKDFERVIDEFELIVGALPGYLGFEFLKTCISLRKNVVDISFLKEDVFELNNLALHNDVTVVFDCGIAPGLSNVILGYHNSRILIDSFKCYIGGLPVKRDPPFQYKAPFSPSDVIEEYLRPARVMEKGKLVVKPALSETERLHFDDVGELEAFNTDGLRSLLKTMNIPNMSEKTLRYPGHRDQIQLLKDAGFFDESSFVFGGYKIKPIDMTRKILTDKWKLENGEEEFTVMKITIDGNDNGENVRIEYVLNDRYDEQTGTTSMARTTGYVCTGIVNLMANGYFNKKGVIPPEFIGADEDCFGYLLKYLKDRNISLQRKVSTA
jgi:saccharopine dehydrogenase-like NADP-dependent oxidoreductase